MRSSSGVQQTDTDSVGRSWFGELAYNTAGRKKPLRLAQEFTGLTSAGYSGFSVKKDSPQRHRVRRDRRIF